MAARFWVGGTATWDATAGTKWATTSGGAGGAAVPTSADDVTFDASSTGTITVNGTVNIRSLTMGAFGGTLTFATNNNDLNAQYVNLNGAGTGTLSMGNGTWTISGDALSSDPWIANSSALTLNANSGTLVFTPPSAATIFNLYVIYGGSTKTYNNVTITAFPSNSSSVSYIFAVPFTCSGTFTVNGVNQIFIPNTTITAGTFNFAGASSTAPILVYGDRQGSIGTLSQSSGTATFAYCYIGNITVSGGATFNATNSFRANQVTGFSSFTGPSGGGGVVGVIGS